MSMRWCPSLLDWHSHLVPVEPRGCPGGALQAVCGQWLLAGRRCQRCAQHATGGAEELAWASAAEVAYGEALRELERLRGGLRELAEQAPDLASEQLRYRLLLLARVVGAPEAEHRATIDYTDECPGCAATAQAWTCAACTVVNPTVRVALAVVGLLPTPQQRTAAFLALLRSEVHRRSGKEHAMTVTVCFPVDQIIEFEAMASVDTTVWWCRLCGQEGTATTTPQATSDAITHLSTDHGGASRPDDGAPGRPGLGSP